MEMPRRDSPILRLVPSEDATGLAWLQPAPERRGACAGGAAPARLGDPDERPGPRAAAQAEGAPEPIRRALLRVLLAADPGLHLDDPVFSYDRRPRNHPSLRGRAGLVSVAGPDAPVRAVVALEPELRMLGANYRDGWHGIAPDAFSRGILMRTLAEKALRVVSPRMPQARRDAVAEHLAFEAAGPHWAFRSLMGVRGAHGDLAAGRRPAERALVLGVACLAMHEALGGATTTPDRPIEAGAALCGAFFAWLSAPGTYEAHPSYPEAFRAFLEERHGLPPVAARAAASRFAAGMERGTAALARSILAERQGSSPQAP